MSDQTNSEKLTESAADASQSHQGRGHGRRAMMAGAAAVGAGAVAAMASPALAATASGAAPVIRSAGPAGSVNPTRSLVVRLPPTALNIDQSINVLQSVLKLAGCGGCYSGWDITFTHEVEFFVDPAGQIQPGI